MILKRFCAENFRNIEKCNIEFGRGVNLLFGDNAQGKTNAVEGIYMFARGKSFRLADDGELVRFGKDGFRISVEYEDKFGESRLEYAVFGRERLRKKNGYKISKAKEMLGSFRAVLFFPDDLELVKGGPEDRRAFLNVAIGQCHESYISAYSKYKKALENRNCILKNAGRGLYFDENELYSWSEYMARYAAVIFSYRKDYIKKLEFYSKRLMKEISDGMEELSLTYKSDIEKDKDVSSENEEQAFILYKKALTENTERECAAGTSLYGIHRDDIVININGVSARSFASQGQQRSIVLSLKLGEGEVSREISGEYPVFLFDDVLSELDDKRKRYITEGIGDRQIIITSCDKEPKNLTTDAKIKVEGGTYN